MKHFVPVAFPLFVLGPNSIIRFETARDLFRQADRFIDFTFHDAGLLDSTGHFYKVLAYSKLRRSLNPLDWFAPAGPVFEIALDLSEPETVDLDTAKGMLRELVLGKHWIRGTHWSKAKFLKTLQSAQGFEGLFASFSYFGPRFNKRPSKKARGSDWPG